MGSGSGEITAIMGEAGHVVTGALGWIGDCVSAIVDNPLVLMCVLLPFVGFAIALVRKLIRTKAR